MIRGAWALALGCALLMAAAPAAPAHAGNDIESLTVQFENDQMALSGTSDQWYTHGTKVSWTYKDPDPAGPIGWLGSGARWLLWPGAGGEPVRIAGMFGQNIYTPETLTSTAFNPDDRPFGGWLYVGAIAQRTRGRLTQTADVKIGVIGPASGADIVQQATHRFASKHKAVGWDNQLRSAAGVEVGYLARYALPLWDERIAIAPHGGLVLGNTRRLAHAGATLIAGDAKGRLALPGLGEGVADTLAPVTDPLAAHGRLPAGIYAFAGVDFAYVGYNRFIEGETFAGHPAIRLHHPVSQYTLGVTMVFPRGVLGHPLRLTYAMMDRGREFDMPSGQPVRRHRVGLLSLTMGF
ncbi:MAG TPA: lipid A deacylase LpxR family protein [Burkholderiaceae bacterium]|nr:lipid A deacylase LpxR family protein [Burkholderiaceae bacterium]